MEDLFITLGVIGFTLTVLSPFFYSKYTKYKLEIERMRLESEVKKEEIRAKNQFDIEKYMADEQLKAGRLQANQAGREAQQSKEDSGMQPDLNDVGTRSYVNGAGAQETDLLNDSRGREKLRY